MPRRAKLSPDIITTIYEKRIAPSLINKIRDRINRESLRLITNINDDMKDRIGDLLKEGEEAGRSVAATASKLLSTGLDKGVFSSARRRAYLIARTELHRARQMAARDCYREANINLLKWIAISDGRICPICQRNHNRIYRLNDLTDDQLPPIHPRCRCRLIPNDFDIKITPKRGREGKIMETKVSPTPKEYRYIVKVKPKKKVKKSLDVGELRKKITDYFDNVTPGQLQKDLAEVDGSPKLRKTIPYTRIKRGSIEYVRGYGLTRLKKELLDDKKYIIQKLNIKPSSLKYKGIQETGEVSFKDEGVGKKYFHMWNVEEPGHPKHMSSVVGKERESLNKSYDFSSTQVELPNMKKDIQKIVDKIDPKDLHPTEKNDDTPHVTVLYGLHTDSPKEVKGLLENIHNIKASISVIDVFQPPERDYDVLIHRIDSPDLNKLNRILKQLPNSNDFVFYQPHLTICYLKRGMGKKYLSMVSGLEGTSILLSGIVFSGKKSGKKFLELKKPYVVGEEWDQKKEMRKGFVMDMQKAKKTLINFKKSKNKGKLIPKNINGKIRWVKSIGDDFWVTTRTQKADMGDTVLVKGQIAKVTAIGEDGITARILNDNSKYQILHENVKLIIKAIK